MSWLETRSRSTMFGGNGTGNARHESSQTCLRSSTAVPPGVALTQRQRPAPLRKGQALQRRNGQASGKAGTITARVGAGQVTTSSSLAARRTRAPVDPGYRTSKRREPDQAPAVPAASRARARNHIRAMGRVLVENVEVVTVRSTVGEEKVSWSSITMV